MKTVDRNEYRELMYKFGNRIFGLKNNQTLLNLMVEQDAIYPTALIGKKHEINIPSLLSNNTLQLRELSQIKYDLDQLICDKKKEMLQTVYKCCNASIIPSMFANQIKVFIEEGLIPAKVVFKDVEFDLAEIAERAIGASESNFNHLSTLEKALDK